MRIDVVTIFPDYLAPLTLSLVGKAAGSGILDVGLHDLRRWTTDVHRTVDDSPFGGGPGMVMKPGPWWSALAELTASSRAEKPRVIVPTPSGRPFTQAYAAELAGAEHLIFACGRYEGIDGRVVERWATDEISIGDYVLGGGEVATLVMVEAIARLIPGVVGNDESIADDSFQDGLVEGRVYTRPAEYEGLAVPDVLRGGDHARIARWQRDESLRRTAQVRPDLLRRLDASQLDGSDLAVLAEQGWQVVGGRLASEGDAVADLGPHSV